MKSNFDAECSRKSTVGYWDENWRRASGVARAGPGRQGYFWRRIDRALAAAIEGFAAPGRCCIEIGAGGSEWLPYLHTRFGLEVTGIDYSPVGCASARERLAEASVAGDIFQGDLFAPPSDLLGRFDIALSFGLVEHFDDTAAALRACAAFVRPGGLVVTLIPNMRGLYGALYRAFDRKVFETHVPLSLDDLCAAHWMAGLEPRHGEYLLGLPGVVDHQRTEPVFLRRWARRLVYYASRVYWELEARGLGVRENPHTSPYLICSGVKHAV